MEKTHLRTCRNPDSFSLGSLISSILIPRAFEYTALNKYFSIRRAALPVSSSYPALGMPAASSSRQYGERPCSLVSSPCACWHGRHLCSGPAFQWSLHRAGTPTNPLDQISSIAR